MIRTTLVGSWPPEKGFSADLRGYHRRERPDSEYESLLREVAAVAIRQQRECSLDEYTGGETSSDHFVLHLPRLLTGVAHTGDTDAWWGRGAYRAIGPIGAPEGLGLASALRRERATDPAITKATIPGPSEMTMMIEPLGNKHELWSEAIELIRREIREFIEAGADDVQLDAPHIAMGLADGGWDKEQAVDSIRRIFQGVQGIRRSVHFCYGDFQARTWVQNAFLHPLLPTIQSLDGVIDRVVLELSLPGQWVERALLAEIPDSIEVAAGIVDVKSQRIETAEEIHSMILEMLDYVPATRLLVCPSCGLGRRNTELAIGKCRSMVYAASSVDT